MCTYSGLYLILPVDRGHRDPPFVLHLPRARAREVFADWCTRPGVTMPWLWRKRWENELLIHCICIYMCIYICINIYIHKLNYIYQEYIYIFICIESRGWLFNPMVSPSWCATPYLCWLTPCFLQFVSNVFSIFLVETRVCLKSSSESMIVVV